jgi:hypothetical protein
MILGTMATLYQHGDFSGSSQEFGVGRHDIGALGDIENDSVSALKVEQGYKVTLFQHGGFNGIQAEFGGGDHDYDAFVSSGIPNDSVSSLVVERTGMFYLTLFRSGTVFFYAHLALV